MDENAVAVPSARITVMGAGRAVKAETDFTGWCEFADLASGLYELRVDKDGFFAFLSKQVQVGETDSVEVTLHHVREYVETVNVVYSAPSIDPTQTTATENLTSEDIVSVPYNVTRDIRYALPLMPDVLQDAFGQIHVNGSSTRQVLDQLDGFDITDPANGLFNLRVSVDAIRAAEVKGSRVSAEYGKGSAGVLSLRTGMGDDRCRWSATDFFPSLQSRKGLHLNTWTPRATISGPLLKGRAWFLDALDAEYDLNIVKELPEGADRNPASLLSNLAKTQINLTSANVLTSSFLVNRFRSEHAGLSPFNPQEATVNEGESASVFTVKDQTFLRKGVLLELGLAASRFHSAVRPLGDRPYVIRPDSTSGNYFATATGRSSRLQGIANLTIAPLEWNGRHEIRAGIDVDRLTDQQSVTRRPFSILREDDTLSRQVTFLDRPPYSQDNVEFSGYVQDRWAASDRALVEAGGRLDWDSVLRRALFSPRLASSLALTRDGNTKLTGGVGLYYDATSLDLLARGLTGKRFDLFYDRTGTLLVRPPIETTLLADARNLRGPRFLNWSLELERKLPAAVYLQVQFLHKRGQNGWAYFNRGAAEGNAFSGQFELGNVRLDRYDGLEITARRAFKGHHVVFVSYTHSKARSTAVSDFSLDNPLFSPQVGGPLPWDTPNHFDTWGWLPLARGFTLAYWLDWRDGFPFGLVNQDQQLVAPPGVRRFPDYFRLNLHVERRFHLLGYEWALRGGFDNITNRANPTVVNNNVDSPRFLTFAASSGRALTGRIRLLGRK